MIPPTPEAQQYSSSAPFQMQIGIGSWNMLTPCSILVDMVQWGRGILAVLIYSFLDEGTKGSIPIDNVQLSIVCGGLMVFLSIYAVLRWKVSRWKVEGEDFFFETGILRRQSFHFPLKRIQAVDCIQQLIPRMFSVTSVQIISAGSGNDKARLSFLPNVGAQQLRAYLLESAATNTPNPSPTAEPSIGVDSSAHGDQDFRQQVSYIPVDLLQIGNDRIIGAQLLRFLPLWGTVFLLLVVFGVASTSSSHLRLVVGATGALATLGLLHVISQTLLRIGSDWNYNLSMSHDGLRLDRGLLEVRHETIPFGRIQAVRFAQPIMWRLTGWYRIELDVARQKQESSHRSVEEQMTRTLAPVVTKEQLNTVLSPLIPGARWDRPIGSRPPWRAALLAPLSFHFLAAWHDELYVYSTTGRIQEAVTVVPAAKLQSVRFSFNIVQRFFRLATVVVDTAGKRWPARLMERDRDDGYALLESIAVAGKNASTTSP